VAIHLRFSMFSGRPNPRYTLSDEESAELKRRIRELKRIDHRRRIRDLRPHGMGEIRVLHDGPTGRLRWRCGAGLVEFPDYPFSFVDTTGLGDWLIGICPDRVLIPEQKRILFDISRFRDRFPSKAEPQPPPAPTCNANPAPDGIPFDPFWGWPPPGNWPRIFCNNCYDYANNQLTDTYSQPGFGTGAIYSSHSGPDLEQAAVRDGLVAVPNCTDVLAPGQGWYVALFTGVDGFGPDFHFMRQDASGCWSQKLDGDSVCDWDAHHNKIKSPEDAVLSYFDGAMHYEFVRYLRTSTGVTIKGSQSTPEECALLDVWV